MAAGIGNDYHSLTTRRRLLAEAMPDRSNPGSAASDLDYPELISKIRAGDPSAENLLVERFTPGLSLLLRRLAQGSVLADDLFQDTIALVLTKIRAGEVRNPQALPAFIHATARNLFIADRRKEKRYQEIDSEKHSDTPHEPRQLSRMVRDEEAALVRRLLGELRFAKDRELLTRYYLTDEPKMDLCRDLGIDPGRFNRVLFRARQRLRELWEKSEKRNRLLTKMSIFFGTILLPVTLLRQGP